MPAPAQDRHRAALAGIDNMFTLSRYPIALNSRGHLPAQEQAQMTHSPPIPPSLAAVPGGVDDTDYALECGALQKVGVFARRAAQANFNDLNFHFGLARGF